MTSSKGSTNKGNPNKNIQGLTIVELLIAMVLLGVLMTAVLTPLTGLFQMTGQSTQTLSATTQAQEVMEHIQAQWRSFPPVLDAQGADRNQAARQQSRNRFDQTCIPDFPSSRDGLSEEVVIWELDSNANQVRKSTFKQACGNAAVANPPPMKRVTITVKTSDPSNTASLTMDIPRP